MAFAVENLQFSYDLVDGVTNPANVRMVAADLAGTGACSPIRARRTRCARSTCSSRAARRRFSVTNEFLRNSLTTQVSLRSLALVDRYR